MATPGNTAFVSETSGDIWTPRCRMLWPALFEPERFRDDPPDKIQKHAITLLVPKGSNIEVLKKEAARVAGEKWNDPASMNLRSPFISVAGQPKLAEHAEDYPIMLRARSIDPPGVVGPDGKRVNDPSLVYGGRWCVVTLQAFAYETKGNRGVSFGLQNVQLLDHDEPLGSARVRAESEFQPVEISSGNADSAAPAAENGAAPESSDSLFS